MARLTICIPVLNGANFLEEALASLETQTSTDFVVLGSNNASTDDTGTILDSWADRLPMQVMHQPETVPMVDHFEILLQAVQTEFFMLLCHDDYLNDPSAIARALQVVDADPSISAVFCDLAFVSEGRRHLLRRDFNRSGRFEGDVTGRNSILMARNMFGIPLLLKTPEIAERTYDKRLKFIMDLDFSWRTAQRGPCWHIPEALIANRFYGQNATWKVMKGAVEEFLILADKQKMTLTERDVDRIKRRNWQLMQKRQIFGLVERIVTRLS